MWECANPAILYEQVAIAPTSRQTLSCLP